MFLCSFPQSTEEGEEKLKIWNERSISENYFLFQKEILPSVVMILKHGWTGTFFFEQFEGQIDKKKSKALSEEALQIAVKRREAKSKGEKERYTHLNAEFQARKDKKAFLSYQYKEIRGKQQDGKD